MVALFEAKERRGESLVQPGLLTLSVFSGMIAVTVGTVWLVARGQGREVA
jgi:hypothetical protein